MLQVAEASFCIQNRTFELKANIERMKNRTLEPKLNIERTVRVEAMENPMHSLLTKG